jgi:hypothetical protein
VIGNLLGKATVGAHASDLNSWADLYLNDPTFPVIVKTDGKFGIGTSDPQGALHVAGNSDPSNTSKALGIHMGVLASSYAHMEIVCSGSFSGWIDFKNANTSGNGDYEERIRGGDGNLEFHTNKAERMKIDASGKVNFSHSEKYNFHWNPGVWSYSTNTSTADTSLWSFTLNVPYDGWIFIKCNAHWARTSDGSNSAGGNQSFYAWLSVGGRTADNSSNFDTHTGTSGASYDKFHSYQAPDASGAGTWRDFNYSNFYKVSAGDNTISLRVNNYFGSSHYLNINGGAVSGFYMPRNYL